MSTPDRRHIIVILDRSGSMNRVREDTEGGLNALLDEQRQVNREGTTVTLVQFDDEVETVYSGKPLTEIPAFSFQPRGMTALMDAVGTTVWKEESRIGKLPPSERPSEVILVILTDGKDNVSRQYEPGLVRHLLDGVAGRGWTTLFLGANQDAFEVAGGLGVSRATTMSFDTSRTQDTLTATGHMIARGTRTGEFTFSGEERSAASRTGE
ncbi:VWA domain-containing protein [Streptomyces sp. NPDC057638]|uniref:vWA domain-containing protein n=1 Tax=Streptomyces sp. NPDC057638 TaxID=3346190 RepID=UPI0036B52823